MSNRLKSSTAIPAYSGTDDRSFSIKQFCQAEGFGITSYYELKRQGLAPDEIRPLPGLIRITSESRAAWHARMQQLAKHDEAALERRRAQTAEAGRTGAASPKHISKRRSAAKAARRSAPAMIGNRS
jgi:hypothetical protein